MANENVERTNISIAFYKGDIIHTYKRKTDDMDMSIIAFPKSSIYAGYVWHWPTSWIKENDKSKDDPHYSFNPDKRWISVKPDQQMDIVRQEQNPETKQWETADIIKITADRIKEAMKRPFKNQNGFVDKLKGGEENNG